MQAIPAKCNTITRRTDNTRTLFLQLQLNHPCIHSSLSLATVSFSSIAPLSYLANNLFEGRRGRTQVRRDGNFHQRYIYRQPKVQKTVLVYLPYYHGPFALLFCFPPTSHLLSFTSTRVYIHSLSLYASIIYIIVSFVSNYLNTSADSPPSGTQVAFAFVIKYILFFTLSYSLNSFFLY